MSRSSASAILFLAIMFVSGCGGGGGGGGGGDGTPLQTLTLQESLRYFPFNDSNLWVSRETESENGIITASLTRVSRRAGSKQVGGVAVSVVSVNETPPGSAYENYFVADSSGITVYGDNTGSDPLSDAIGPFRLVNFPLQIGSTFRQIDRTNLDAGEDLNGDGINERVSIRSDVVVRGFETVITSAGTFQNCLRVDTNITETVLISTTGQQITVTGVESDWYAQDIGPVKQMTSFSVIGQTTQTTEELTGYMVDGRSSGLSLRTTPTTATINAGATVQLNVALLDAATNELATIPAAWTSSDSTVATVDASGLATGIKAGTASLTPFVAGVPGPSASLNVLLGFNAGIRYPVPAGVAGFSGGDTAIGDLNGDGRTDVAVMEAPGGSRILIYLQIASGALDASQVVTTTLNVKGVAVGDVNNDGLADLVISGNSTTAAAGWLGRVSVYRQNPATHTLDAPQEFTLSTDTAGTLEVADLNSDGLPDILVASSGSGNGLLSFLFQGAGGTLGSESVLGFVPIYPGGEVHVADMNGDGRKDIVVQSDLKQLAVIRQTSAGVYITSPELYTVQTSYWTFFKSFALGDLNGDGRTDIAVADPGNSGYLNIFLQSAAGILAGPQLLTTFGFATQDEVKIADMNGDGLSDIVVISGGYMVQVNLQTASHTFTVPQTFYLPTLSSGGTVIHQAMALGDLTGDGLPDVVASWANEGVYVLPSR